MPKTRSVTEVRQNISSVIDEVVDLHTPQVVERRGRDEVILIERGDFEEQFLSEADFHPEVFNAGGMTSIWLPELALYGRGEDFFAAKADLAEEVRAYVEDFTSDVAAFLRAPNRKGHFRYVIKAMLADSHDRLEQILFPVPGSSAEPKLS